MDFGAHMDENLPVATQTVFTYLLYTTTAFLDYKSRKKS
jgi:hypothetical protein